MGHKKTEKKCREELVTMKFSRPVKINSIQFDNSKFRLLEDGKEIIPERITYEKSISRENKPNKKIVYSEIEECNINVYSLFEKYDYLIGIDTNTKLTEYGDYSAAGVVISQIINCKTHIELVEFPAIASMVPRFNKEQSRELVGLWMLIKSIVNNTLLDYSLAKGILIIVDHNLDKIDRYNDHTISLISENDATYLPHKIRLMYASADKKNDSIFNQIIKKCDQIATKMIDDQVAQERMWDEQLDK